MMAVYVDDYRASVSFSSQRAWKMSHMIADTRSELDEMVERLELDQKWKQNCGEQKEHFDIVESKRQWAIKFGAKTISCKELVCKMRDRDLKYYLEH